MAATALVLGGGFAGLETAIQLRRAKLDVTLVSDRPFLFLFPTSIWVATGTASFEEQCIDLQSLAGRHGFRFLLGRIERIDAARRTAVIDGREHSADHLVVALGGGKLKPEGAEHTATICGAPQDSLKVKQALDRLLERGSGRIAMGFGGNPGDPSGVRGGPAFELMFNVDTLLRRRGVRDRFELVFFAPMAVPGARMGDKAVAAVGRLFEQHRIGTRYGKKITRFEPGVVHFEDASRLEADLVMFIAAVDGHPVVKSSDLPRNAAGFVQVDEGCAVPGFDKVWAVGDAAALQGPDWRAKQGHLAEVMARVAAHNIAAQEAGSTERHSYLPHVNILCVMDTGDGAAWVYRDDRRQRMVPLPVVGHWMKQGWGTYFRLTKNRLLPRIPGL